MTLAAVLAAFRANPATLRQAPLPRTPAVAKAARRLAERIERIAEVEKVDHAALLAKLRRFDAAGDWSSLTPRDLRHAPRVLWNAERKLNVEVEFLQRYVEAIDRHGGRLPLRALAREYLRRFRPDLEGKTILGRALLARCRSLSKPWSDPACAARLFDPGDDGRSLGRLALEHPDGPIRVLEEHGLGGAKLGAGIVAAAFAAALDLVQARLERNPDLATLDRIIGWAVGEDGKLRYAGNQGKLAEALLLPWVAHDPDDEIRRLIEDFLLTHLQDPRLFSKVWQGVHDDARGVFTRWLAKASLETFLRVFDRHAKPHQWRYRRAFWTAYADRGYVRNAQVVFAPSIAGEARELARQTKDARLGRFAWLYPAPQSDHAVLLLEIGDLVVADWSHDGTLRIWQRRDEAAPHLNRGEYNPEELRRRPKLRGGDDYFETRHWPQGPWQQKAHDFIARHTRIRLLTSDFMPGG
jgi:hypothetical protein